jgi:hypothetical protein
MRDGRGCPQPSQSTRHPFVRNDKGRDNGVYSSQETDMETAAILTSILVAIFVAMFLPLFLSGERWRAAEDKAHARRLADARMNARLLRLNL